jgi:hypothetical protein
MISMRYMALDTLEGAQDGCVHLCFPHPILAARQSPIQTIARFRKDIARVFVLC